MLFYKAKAVLYLRQLFFYVIMRMKKIYILNTYSINYSIKAEIDPGEQI